MYWFIKSPDAQHVQRLKNEFRCSTPIAKVLVNRGIVSLEQSRSFFNPSLSQLHDPFSMKDMDRAVERIIQNITDQIPILVFGDYDVDGTTGASVLYLALQQFGAKVETYIPDREKEGYGLSNEGLNHGKEIGANLIITCDCGINAFDHVNYANSNGLDVIITDHHTPDETLPDAYAILNPKRQDCEYPFKGLCGCGVALKLVQAVGMKTEQDLNIVWDLLDLVTLGTASDMVPIIDENRIIVHHGLSLIPSTSKAGLQALLRLAGLEDKLPTVGQLVFGVAPRINAAGRLGDANRSVELLTTMDSNRANDLANELDVENKRRQDIQLSVIDEAIRKVNAEVDLVNDRAIVLAGLGWHAGVVGIVASRLKEEYNRPSIVISMDKDGIGKGSARSVHGLDLYEALTKVNQWLEGYGGHPMAAGLTVTAENYNSFRQAFLDVANSTLTDEDLIPSLYLDGDLALKDIDQRFLTFLEKLGPFGPSNMRPKFATTGVEIAGNPRVIGNGDHIRFRARQGRTTFNAIGFNQSHQYETLIKGLPVDLAYVVELNVWQGHTNVQLNIRDIALSKERNIKRLI